MIAYTDDLRITEYTTKKELIKAVKTLDRETEKLGLKIDECKIQYIRLQRENVEAEIQLKVQNYKFEEGTIYNSYNSILIYYIF